jgi:hypothetical protein
MDAECGDGIGPGAAKKLRSALATEYRAVDVRLLGPRFSISNLGCFDIKPMRVDARCALPNALAAKALVIVRH